MKKFKKALALFVTMAIAVTMLTVTASAKSVFASAKNAESGKTYSGSIITAGESKAKHYKIKVSKKAISR